MEGNFIRLLRTSYFRCDLTRKITIGDNLNYINNLNRRSAASRTRLVIKVRIK